MQALATAGTFFVCFGDMPHLEHKILKVQIKYIKKKNKILVVKIIFVC